MLRAADLVTERSVTVRTVAVVDMLRGAVDDLQPRARRNPTISSCTASGLGRGGSPSEGSNAGDVLVLRVTHMCPVVRGAVPAEGQGDNGCPFGRGTEA